MRRLAAAALVAAALAPPTAAQPQPTPDEGALARTIEALRVADVAWRRIAWNTCLLDGLLEARRSGKPLLYWCQIDRPVDDTRC